MRSNPLIYIDPSGHAQACVDGDEGGDCGGSSPMGLYDLLDDPDQVEDAVRDYLRNHPQYQPENDPAMTLGGMEHASVARARMQVSQEANGSTLAFGVTGMGGAGAIGRGDFFYAKGYNSEGDWFYSYGGGATFPPPPFISGGLSLTLTNAPSVDKLTGLTHSVGGILKSLPFGGLGISFEFDKFPDSNSNRMYTGLSISIGGTLSANPLAGGVYSTVTNTQYLFP